MKFDLDVIMPMAGQGTRVKALAASVAKPFIMLDGIPLYQHALNSLSKFANIHTKVAVLPQGTVQLDDFISITPAPTRGPLESAYLGAQLLTSNRPFAILDCDLVFSINPQNSLDLADASIITFNSSQVHFSYAEVDCGKVKRIVEKIVISPHAVAGCYFFKDRTTFLKNAHDILQHFPPTQEPYLSHLIQSYITQKFDVSAFSLSRHESLGTSDEIRASGRHFSFK